MLLEVKQSTIFFFFFLKISFKHKTKKLIKIIITKDILNNLI